MALHWSSPDLAWYNGISRVAYHVYCVLSALDSSMPVREAGLLRSEHYMVAPLEVRSNAHPVGRHLQPVLSPWPGLCRAASRVTRGKRTRRAVSARRPGVTFSSVGNLLFASITAHPETSLYVLAER